MLMELRAYQAYKNPELPITFWRTSTGREVDFILGDKELAVEVKAGRRVHEGDIRSLLALLDDGPVKKCCVVCLESEPRFIHSAVEVIPWRQFVQRLWDGEFCS
jgi:predicted AAA+ superfamily ATPase